MSATHNIEHEVTNTTDHESKPGAHKFVLKKKRNDLLGELKPLELTKMVYCSPLWSCMFQYGLVWPIMKLSGPFVSFSFFMV